MSLGIIGAICWCLGTGAYVASMVTVQWKTVDLLSVHYNLFQRCIGSFCSDMSWNPDDVGIEIFIPRILMLVGAAMVVVGTLIGIVGYLCNAKSCTVVSEGVLIICGGVVICAACAVFTGLTINDFGSFDYSFYLGWASGGLYLLSGCFICCSAQHTS